MLNNKPGHQERNSVPKHRVLVGLVDNVMIKVVVVVVVGCWTHTTINNNPPLSLLTVLFLFG